MVFESLKGLWSQFVAVMRGVGRLHEELLG
jgi:hypothetical protein